MPRAILPQGQTDAGHEKAAQNQDLFSKALCLTIFCCLSCPFGHRNRPLCIRFYLLYTLSYPLHLVHQGLDLEFHHVLRHLREKKRHSVRDGLVHHHHGQRQIAEQPWVNTVRRQAKDLEQFSVKDNLVLPKRLKILLRETMAHLLLLLNGQNSDSAFGSVTAVF